MKPTAIRPQREEDDSAQASKPAPTVMSSAEKSTSHQPTIISGEKVVASGHVPDQPAPMPKPTTGKAPAKKDTFKAGAPTAMPGFKLERIPVTLEQLSQLNHGVKLEVIQRAMRLILLTHLDEGGDREAVLWGCDLQQGYGDLVSKSLALSQSASLTKATSYISRMLEILGLINLKKICGLEGGDNFLSRLVKKATRSIDSLEELAEGQRELGQLVQLMNKQLSLLLQLKEQITLVSTQIDALGDSVEAQAIAAAFLSDFIERRYGAAKAGLSQHFEERQASLTQTLAQIRSSVAMRAVQVQQPLRLINTMQHTALVMVPGWLGSIVSLRTMLEGQQQPTVTEINELSDQMREIITRLKGD